jgi:hypothetical protein
MSWPQLVAWSAGLAATDAAAGVSGYLEHRVLPLLLGGDADTLPLMAYNLLRFITWQNLALIPLLAAAVPAMRRGASEAEALGLGILLTFVAMVGLLPYQGHGWGYRYFHGLLGSFALLGAYGWERLQREGVDPRRLLVPGTAATLLVAMPFLAWQAHAFVKPYADLDRTISKLDADFVVLDTDPQDFVVDSVRNDPWLRDRPVRLSSRHLDGPAVNKLCARGTVAFVGSRHMGPLGLEQQRVDSGPRFAALKAQLAGRPCLRD